MISVLPISGQGETSEDVFKEGLDYDFCLAYFWTAFLFFDFLAFTKGDAA
jgi:hypothetical protein